MLTTPNLGRLQRVDLRAVWSSESGNFTPWLAQPNNLALLGETIGLELEPESTEKHVGPFRADILCKETLTNNWVLIENQLERTDHSHLGQLLTYAAGLSTVTIVWVAERFTDEHRAALDWLNEVTEEGINFFGLEVELWRIGDSAIAPKFNVISQPNDWTKQAATAREVAAASEFELRRLEFWTGFKRYLEDTQSLIHLKTPPMLLQTRYAIGRADFGLNAYFVNDEVAVNLGIGGVNAKVYFHLLEKNRDTIEKEIGETLTWQELPDKKQSFISVYWNNIDTSNRELWPDLHEWLKEKLETYQRVLGPRVKLLNAADYVPPLPSETVDGEPL